MDSKSAATKNAMAKRRYNTVRRYKQTHHRMCQNSDAGA